MNKNVGNNEYPGGLVVKLYRVWAWVAERERKKVGKRERESVPTVSHTNL